MEKSHLLLASVFFALYVASGVAPVAQSAAPAAQAVPPIVLRAPGPTPEGRVPQCTTIASTTGLPDADCTKANAPRLPNEKGGTGETGPYEVVPGFFKPTLFPQGYTWSRVGGIFAESPDRIYVYVSGILPVESSPPWGALLRYFNLSNQGIIGANTRREFVLTVFDRSGKQIEAWRHVDKYHGQGSVPHRVRVSPYDPQKHVWLIDEGNPPFDQIVKYTRDGKEVMRIAGKAATSDIAFLPNGDFLAIQRTTTDEPFIRYSKDGKELGRMGPKGATSDAHCADVDKQGNIYVGEMAGGRVQVFDATGKSIDIWPNIRVPNYCALDQNQNLWVFDTDSSQFLKYDRNGKLLTNWGTFGYYPGRFIMVNQFDVDREGNLYTAEPLGWRPQMLRPKPNAKKDELIGPLHP
jgi:hypothetical protein